MKSCDLTELALSFQKSRIFLTAYELGIFTRLGRSSSSSHRIADSLGTARRHTDRLMNALCSLGLLKKRGGRFSNTRASLQYLVSSSPKFANGIMHNVHMWNTWSDLTETVRHGRPAIKTGINDRGEKWLKPFIATMHERAVKSASSVARSLDLSGVFRVLDVGGGSGAYAMAFAKAHREITATVFDLPNVIPITKKYVKEEGLLNKIDFVAGDYKNDDLGSGYDLVFLSAIIHINSPSQNRILIRKAASALRGNGQIVIQDFIMNEDRVNPPAGAYFALNMLVVTAYGDTYTKSEVRSWLKDAGFINITFKYTAFGTALVIGRRKTAHARPALKKMTFSRGKRY